MNADSNTIDSVSGKSLASGEEYREEEEDDLTEESRLGAESDVAHEDILPLN